MTHDPPPSTTPDCCEAWSTVRELLDWFVFEDWPGVCAMPVLPGSEHGLRVNFCPVCGAERRSAIWNRNDAASPPGQPCD